MGLSRSFIFAHFAGLLFSSVSALELGAEILDEETKEPLGFDLLQVCRPPDIAAYWGPIVIDPMADRVFCETTGPGIAAQMTMHSDWKWRISMRRPADEGIRYTYIHLVGPESSIPMTNDPRRPTGTWFGYGVNSYKGYEASIFEVVRKDADGNLIPQTISFENPLQVGDALEWAGPNDVEGDYQLRVGSNTDTGVKRIMRSDKPINDFPPIRLVVLRLHEADVLAELPPERIPRKPKPEITSVQEAIAMEERDTPAPQPNYVPTGRGSGISRGKEPSLIGSMARSVVSKFGFGGGKSGGGRGDEESKEETKKEIQNNPSGGKGLDISYEDPFSSKIKFDKNVVEDAPSKFRWSSFWGGKGKGKEVEEVTQEEVIRPRPVTHAREPIQEEDPETWFQKGTGHVKSLFQRIPPIKIPNVFQRGEQEEPKEPEEQEPETLDVDDLPDPESDEEDANDNLLQSSPNKYGDYGPANGVL
ncbi:hypothetical protein TWF281_006486 [Arthrobotrys megalospora]